MNKVIKTCIAMAAFAAFLVVPSIASAENDATVEAPTGTPLVVSHEKPAFIEGKAETTNLVMTAADGTPLVTCQTATITGQLETNTHTTVEATLTTAEFRKHATATCDSIAGATTITPNHTNNITDGLNWCLRSTNTMATDEFQVRGGGCTEAARRLFFILDTAVAGKCEYERSVATGPVKGTYTTHPSDAVLTVSKSEFKKVGGGAFCPGTGFLDMSFTLQTDPGAAPVYIRNATP